MISYRPDITALRAVAVLPVVLFHLGAPIMTGGYVGVDVFFVISGFLITRLIADDIEARTFTVARFYERRVRRIFPALFVMMLVVSLACYMTLMPPEFKNFGESLAATAAFSSNLMFWYQGMDYFDGPADLKPLLHTWSLAVEEQYYIVFPLFMVAVRSKRTRLVLLSVIALISLGLSQHALQVRPSSAFYLPQDRCWELLLGSLISLAPRRLGSLAGRAAWLQIASLLAIILPMITFTANTRFPGIAALPPVLGAGAVLYAGETPGSAISKLACWAPAAFFGSISYSLYLWHWPIIVLYKYLVMRDLRAVDMGLIFTASVIAATASYHLVENPARRIVLRRRLVFAPSLAAISVFILAGVGVAIAHGLPARFAGYRPPPVAEATVQPPPGCWGGLGDTGEHWPGVACAITTGRHRAILWGDSFALHYVEGFEANRTMIDSTLLLLARSGCPPLIGFEHPLEPSCRIFNDHALQYILAMKPESVILSARWIYNALNTTDLNRVMQALQRTVQVLEAHNINVLVVGQSPSFRFKNTYDYLFRLAKAGLNSSQAAPPLDFAPPFQTKLEDASAPAHFFDPMNVVCPDYQCRVIANGQYLTFDGGHLTRAKSIEIVDAILRMDCVRNWQVLAARCARVQEGLQE